MSDVEGPKAASPGLGTPETLRHTVLLMVCGLMVMGGSEHFKSRESVEVHGAQF
jgi:hypothetical protein